MKGREIPPNVGPQRDALWERAAPWAATLTSPALCQICQVGVCGDVRSFATAPETAAVASLPLSPRDGVRSVGNHFREAIAVAGFDVN